MSERISCKKHCLCWDFYDNDCEIYGEQHTCPRKCPFWLADNKIKAKDLDNNKIQDKEKAE